MNKIQWLKWTHPLGPGEEWGGEHGRRLVNADSSIGMADEPVVVRPVVPTPAGLAPLHINVDLHATFNFWMGHANFRLTKRAALAMQKVDGVETLDILTDYRFRVGVGLAFDAEEVLLGIERLFGVIRDRPGEENPGGIKPPPHLARKARLARAAVEGDSRFWSMLMLPNGSIDVSRCGDDRQLADRQLRLYRRTQNAVGGIIFKNVEC